MGYKLFHGLRLLALNNEIDLSNEVLNIDFGRGSAKISKAKVGGRTDARRGRQSWQIFYSTYNFDL